MSADLRRLAAAATPGPWLLTNDDDYGADIISAHPDHTYVAVDHEGLLPCVRSAADAAYIAAASPDVVTALLDRVDALEGAIERERELRDERVKTAHFHIAHDGTVRHPDTCSGCRAARERGATVLEVP